jgi:hypothetical protein
LGIEEVIKTSSEVPETPMDQPERCIQWFVRSPVAYDGSLLARGDSYLRVLRGLAVASAPLLL